MAHLQSPQCASVATLMQIKDVTRADANRIRNIWKTEKSLIIAREKIDAILRTHGVEYLGWHKRAGEHVYYCNAGDTYAGTVLFTGLRMHVGCWGDLVERRAIAEVQP